MFVHSFDWVILVSTSLLILIVVAISIQDFKTMRIPDALTLTLGLVGLFTLTIINQDIPYRNLFSAVVMFMIFLLMRIGYARIKGKPGLGFGDVKLAGASAIWISPWFLSSFLFIACISCIVYVLIKGFIFGRETLQNRIPFGPFLGFGLVAIWLNERVFGQFFL